MKRETLFAQGWRVFRCASLSVIVLLTATAAYAQEGAVPLGDGQDPIDALQQHSRGPIYIIPGKPEISTLYHDGSQIEIQLEQRWRFMCGSDLTGLTVEDLRSLAERHNAAFENGPDVIIDTGPRDGGMNIIYNLDASVPSEAYDAFVMAELFLEDLFGDDIEVRITVKFEPMGSGILGGTYSWYRANESYRNSRDGLQNGMDADDVIQSWLPPGTTIPVRYNGNNNTITDENRIDWTKANYRATIGTVTGNAAGMTINSQVNWDYDPSNGVNSNKFSFVDVVLHETGHALGFTSAVDGTGGQMHALDIYRFQRSDGEHDYNPDTYEEFQTTPRLVDYNVPNDQHISDLIDFTYRMEDGYPYQGSHFRLASNIGLMGPAFAPGQTRYPDFFSSGDVNMFDAIGYDYPACSVIFTTQPEPSQRLCEGENVLLSVAVENAAIMTFQWRRGTTNLVDDGVHIFGATTATLTIVNLTEADGASDYNCLVYNTVEDCSASSAHAEIIVDPLPVILQQPQSQTVNEGDPVQFSVTIENPISMEFQWRKDGNPLSDTGRIFGTTTDTLMIYPVEAGDAGEYDCVITSILGAQCTTTSDAATLTVNSENDCPEDLNGDGHIGLEDLAALLAAYGSTPGDPNWDPAADFNGDNIVDLSDLSQLLSVYGQECPTR